MCNYFELKDQLTELLDAFDGETNEETQKDIELHVAEIKGQLLPPNLRFGRSL